MAKKTILAVDDEEMILKLVEDIFTPEGYNVVKAGSGKEALDTLSKTKVDLVLLDIMMPDMDGWDVCEKIKSNKQTQNIPIIFVTAKTDPVSRSMGSLASVDYVTKPFNMKDLKERVAAAIQSKKQS